MLKPAPERIAKGLWWDRPWKLVEGCRPVSEGCRYCWAAREANMRRNHPNEKISAQYKGLLTPEGRWNGVTRFLEKNLDRPLRVKKPTVWAVWNDLFAARRFPQHGWYCDDAWGVMIACSQHLFMLLTKRAENAAAIAEYYPPQAHILFGATMENQYPDGHAFGIQDRWRFLRIIQEQNHPTFLSVEPMLRPVVIPDRVLSRLSLVICGGESGPNARPMQAGGARFLRDQCVEAGVPFFF